MQGQQPGRGSTWGHRSSNDKVRLREMGPTPSAPGGSTWQGAPGGELSSPCQPGWGLISGGAEALLWQGLSRPCGQGSAHQSPGIQWAPRQPPSPTGLALRLSSCECAFRPLSPQNPSAFLGASLLLWAFLRASRAFTCSTSQDPGEG